MPWHVDGRSLREPPVHDGSSRRSRVRARRSPSTRTVDAGVLATARRNARLFGRGHGFAVPHRSVRRCMAPTRVALRSHRAQRHDCATRRRDALRERPPRRRGSFPRASSARSSAGPGARNSCRDRRERADRGHDAELRPRGRIALRGARSRDLLPRRRERRRGLRRDAAQTRCAAPRLGGTGERSVHARADAKSIVLAGVRSAAVRAGSLAGRSSRRRARRHDPDPRLGRGSPQRVGRRQGAASSPIADLLYATDATIYRWTIPGVSGRPWSRARRVRRRAAARATFAGRTSERSPYAAPSPRSSSWPGRKDDGSSPRPGEIGAG